MADKKRILPKVVLAVVVIVSGVYAVVKLDIWQAERRAQQDLDDTDLLPIDDLLTPPVTDEPTIPLPGDSVEP